MERTARDIPSVDRVLRELGEQRLARAVVAAVVKREIAAAREVLTSGGALEVGVIEGVRRALAALERARLRRVINATGVIVHTNLGRSPVAGRAARAAADAAAGYVNLEMDLESGERGARGGYVEALLAALCGAEAALVVNNCAAALVLAVRRFVAGGRDEVIVSRGELVQIGGGFRVPEMLEASGARLREVGTTNRTTAGDYRAAVGERTALVLRVHRSNFYMDGFVESPGVAELAAVAREHEVPFVVDAGSGATFDTRELGGGEQEPRAGEELAAGADLVCFSGDKLLGGPQAGVVAGRREMVASLKRHPMYRALRCDKMTMAAMQETVQMVLAGEATPVEAMMREDVESVRRRAEGIVKRLGSPAWAEVVESEGKIGGGALPRTVVRSAAVAMRPRGGSVEELARRLRVGDPAVLGVISKGRMVLDVRTVSNGEEELLIEAVRRGVGEEHGPTQSG